MKLDDTKQTLDRALWVGEAARQCVEVWIRSQVGGRSPVIDRPSFAYPYAMLAKIHFLYNCLELDLTTEEAEVYQERFCDLADSIEAYETLRPEYLSYIEVDLLDEASRLDRMVIDVMENGFVEEEINLPASPAELCQERDSVEFLDRGIMFVQLDGRLLSLKNLDEFRTRIARTDQLLVEVLGEYRGEIEWADERMWWRQRRGRPRLQ